MSTSAPTEKLRIIVGGLVGQYPLGGVAWDYFHYCLALAELGHDVYYHEDTWVWPHHPIAGYAVDDPDYTVNFIRDFFHKYAPGLADKWCYVLLHDKHFGMSRAEFDDVCSTADVYLNVSGACFVPDNLGPQCRKVFVDTDPGYNQIVMATKPAWSENVDRWVEQVKAHDVHLTFAENIHGDDCPLPTLGLDWKPTRSPISLPQWEHIRQTPAPPGAPMTTVMTWKWWPGEVEWDGVHYHAKAAEFEKFEDLPGRVPQQLELAVAGEKFDRQHFAKKGWLFTRALPVSVTPQTYQDYILCSAGEWSIAKHVYNEPRTGWFSCRTACYLAAGRPAVVQDTGWGKQLPTSDGCIGFNTFDEAVAGLQKVQAEPQRHAAAAYDFAREYLAPDKILPKMIDDIFADA